MIENKEIIVVATGTFDLLHKGHIKFLNEAKSLGDKLYVVVARDETVLKVKGKPSFHNEDQRLSDVLLVPSVDKAFLGYSGDKYKILEEINPDIIALGYDQKAFTDHLEDELKKRGVNAVIVRIGAHSPDRFKSSKLKEVLPTHSALS